MPDTPRPTLDRFFERFTLPFLVMTSDGGTRLVGSMFLIACFGRQALAVTAKHVIDDISRTTGQDYLPELRVAEPFRARIANMRPENEHIFQSRDYTFGDAMPFGLVVDDNRNLKMALVTTYTTLADDRSDVCIVRLLIPDEEEFEFSNTCPMLIEGPQIGEEVYSFGFINMEINSTERIVEDHDSGWQIDAALTTTIRRGSVIEAYSWNEEGYYLNAPCFRVSYESPSGMSGGPVFAIRRDEYVFCGMVSQSDGHTSLLSRLIPLLGMRPPYLRINVGTSSNDDYSIRNFIEFGIIQDFSESEIVDMNEREINISQRGSVN